MKTYFLSFFRKAKFIPVIIKKKPSGTHGSQVLPAIRPEKLKQPKYGNEIYESKKFRPFDPRALAKEIEAHIKVI